MAHPGCSLLSSKRTELKKEQSKLTNKLKRKKKAQNIFHVQSIIAWGNIDWDPCKLKMESLKCVQAPYFYSIENLLSWPTLIIFELT